MSIKTYKLNSQMRWTLRSVEEMPANTPIWVIAEEETCDPTQIPSVFRVIHNPDGEFGYKTKLLDFDPEDQDEILSPNRWEIIAWRRMTDHNSSFDEYYEKHGVTEMSNWSMELDPKIRNE